MVRICGTQNHLLVNTHTHMQNISTNMHRQIGRGVTSCDSQSRRAMCKDKSECMCDEKKS